MTGVITGFAGRSLGAPRAEPGQIARERRRRDLLFFVVGLAFFRSLRAAFADTI